MIEGETPLSGGDPPGLDTLQNSWLRVLLRLWCLKPADARTSGDPRAIVFALGLACLGAWVGIDWVQRQPEPEFSIEGIPLIAWYVLAVVALAGLLWWRIRPRPPFAAMLILSLGAFPVPLLLVGGR